MGGYRTWREGFRLHNRLARAVRCTRRRLTRPHKEEGAKRAELIDKGKDGKPTEVCQAENKPS